MLVLVLATLVAGCSGHRQAATVGGSQLVRITEHDFGISAPTRVSTGNLRLWVKNKGPDNHELLIVPLRGAGVLPLRADGFTVNEELLGSRIVYQLDPGRPGALRELDVHLAPGRYEFFCNMSGHYLGGMHVQIDVQS